MKVQLTVLEHACTGPDECGETVSQLGLKARLVRKYLLMDGEQTMAQAGTREAALAIAEKRGWEVE